MIGSSSLIKLPGIFLIILLSGCIQFYQKAEPKVMAVSTAEPVELAVANKKIGSDIKIYEVAVKISKLPKNPRLVLDFTVVDKGHCMVTYEPTRIFVNDIKIASIDFRDFEFKARQVIDVKIPQASLKLGDNIIRVHTGECEYDIDIMRFNSFKFFQR